MYNCDIGLPEVVVTTYTQSVEVTQTAVFTATVTGVGPFNHQWQKKGNNITGETGSVFIIYEVSLSDQANYSCYVSNNYGDSAVSSISLQVTSMQLGYTTSIDVMNSFCRKFTIDDQASY